jgi:hypothetical protein
MKDYLGSLEKLRKDAAECATNISPVLMRGIGVTV